MNLPHITHATRPLCMIVLMGVLGIIPSISTAEVLEYEHREVTVSAKSQCESNRDLARSYAEAGAKNKAHAACEAMGKGWRYDKQLIAGYLGFQSCKWLGDGFLATVDQSTHRCMRLDQVAMDRKAKERAEKEKAQRANEAQNRAEKGRSKAAREQEEAEKAHQEAVRKARQEKISKQKSSDGQIQGETEKKREKAKTPAGNVIDDAFASLEQAKPGKRAVGFDDLEHRYADRSGVGLESLDSSRKSANDYIGHGVDAAFVEVERERAERRLNATINERTALLREASDRDAQAEKSCQPIPWSPPARPLYLTASTGQLSAAEKAEVEMEREIQRQRERDEDELSKIEHAARERERQRGCDSWRATGPTISTPSYKTRLKEIDDRIASVRQQRDIKEQELRALTRRED